MNRWAKRGLTALACSIAAVLVAEGIIRWTGLAPDPGLFTVTEREFQRFPGIFAPNQHAPQAEGTRFEHTVRINNLGYRGADLPATKPTGETRILFVGDSFTWGHNVADDETMAAQLETVLSPACEPVRAMNGGLSGSSIVGQDAMARRGLSTEPDAVVLTYYENDMNELIHVRIWDGLAANRAIKSRPPVSLVYPVLRESAIWGLAQQVRRGIMFRRKGQTAPPMGDQSVVLSSDEVAGARAEYAERLTGLHGHLVERGVPFLLVTFPSPETAQLGQAGPDYEWLRGLAGETGIATLDLLPHMTGSDEQVADRYLLPEDYHPSAEGHRLAAQAIGAELLARGFLNRCS